MTVFSPQSGGRWPQTLLALLLTAGLIVIILEEKEIPTWMAVSYGGMITYFFQNEINKNLENN